MIFRAIWPITDETAGIAQLTAIASHDLRLLAAQAHARPTGPGRWSVARSAHIPGSGRVTTWVLLYECPAVRRTSLRLAGPTSSTRPDTSTTTSTGAAA